MTCAVAEPIWPWTTPYTHMPYTTYMPSMYTMPLVKPVDVKPLKVEEYTNTYEYKTGMPEYMPYFYPYKLTKMPEVETDYAAKGKYEAVAAGGVVHKAKREADPLLMYSNWGSVPLTTSTYSHPMIYGGGILPYHSSILPYSWPIKYIEPKPIVANDRMKEGTPDYAMKGQYEAVSAGVVHKAKREADPLLVYKNILPTYYRSPLLHHTTTPFVGTYPFVNRYINSYPWY